MEKYFPIPIILLASSLLFFWSEGNAYTGGHFSEFWYGNMATWTLDFWTVSVSAGAIDSFGKPTIEFPLVFVSGLPEQAKLGICDQCKDAGQTAFVLLLISLIVLAAAVMRKIEGYGESKLGMTYAKDLLLLLQSLIPTTLVAIALTVWKNDCHSVFVDKMPDGYSSEPAAFAFTLGPGWYIALSADIILGVFFLLSVPNLQYWKRKKEMSTSAPLIDDDGLNSMIEHKLQT